MTEDFKEKLLKYLTGNIVEESGTDTPTYQPIQEYMNNLDIYIRNELDTNSYTIENVYQSKTNSNIVLLGNNSGTSFIIVLNEKLLPLACITKFSSDVNFKYFTGLNVDENGYFYCIEADNSTKRFLMLNNIAVADTTGEYMVKIRRSYSVPSSVNLYSSSYVVTKIIKAIGQSIYLILNTNGSTRYITKLTVNVGIENEWVDILMNGVNGVDQWASIDSEGNVLLKTINPGYSTGAYQYGIGVYFYNNGTESTQTYTDTTISGLEVRRANGIILNETTAYVSYKVSDTNHTYTKYMINMVNLVTGTITNIYEETDVYGVYAGDLNPILFQNVNGTILFKITVVTDLTQGLFKIVAGRIGNNVYSFDLKTNLTIQNYYADFFIATQNFNLLQYMVQFGDNVYYRKEVFNPLGYNGGEYETINCLVPSTSRIYDGNGDLVFARNLYNKSVNGNTTVSTVEIPNTFLNDSIIGTKELYGETNILLSYDINEITKNIYESLDINFFNTLTMVNANTQNEIINIVGASRLNNSVSNTVDYASAKASKIRINYQDGDTLIQNISIPTITNGIATYTFNIYVEKTITNIDILSNDTNTIYQTIEGNFNIGSTYTITQDVRVE